MSTLVLSNFEAALDYSSLYRSVINIFLMSLYYSENLFSIEKLSSAWNKQTNFNKLGI